MDERTRKLALVAKDAKDYRAFLSRTFDVLGETSRNGKFSHAAFARKAGFKARGFAQEVVTGRKRITAQTYPKFETALALPHAIRGIFKYLVIKEEADLNTRGMTSEQIDLRLRDLRDQIESDLALTEKNEVVAEEVHGHRHILTVYAVLGNRERGASFDEVVQRTGLQAALCRRVLDHLLSRELAREEMGRYFSINPHLVFKGMGGTHPAKAAFLETVGELKHLANEDFSNPERVFIQSHFSIDPKRLPELKKRLWDVILEFVDEFDHDDGTRVGRLAVAFAPTSMPSQATRNSESDSR